MFWKILWKHIPQQILTRISINEDFTVSTVMPRLQTVQMGYLWRASSAWNLLPHEIRSL